MSSLADAPVTDVHAHLVPVDPARLGDHAGVRVTDGNRLEVDGRELGPARLYRADLLIEWMDLNQVDVALVSVPPPLYRQQLGEADARSWTAYLNDGLAQMAADFPDRLKVLAHLPLQHPAVAASEAVSRRGEPYAGFSLPAGGVQTIMYSDPALRPLWATLDQQGSFAFLHPGACADGRLADFYAGNLLGNPYETAVAAAHLVFGGVLEEFPSIQFCLAHCGGAVAAVAGRWQRGFDTARPGVDTDRQPPARVLRHFFVDCVAHDHGLLTLAEQVFGEDRILFGSDWPFPMGLDKPNEWLRTLSPGRRERIMRLNFAALRQHAAAMNC